jgi:hypothetical protein
MIVPIITYGSEVWISDFELNIFSPFFCFVFYFMVCLVFFALFPSVLSYFSGFNHWQKMPIFIYSKTKKINTKQSRTGQAKKYQKISSL